MKNTVQFVLLMVEVNFLKACDINRACKPILESPISPSISLFGVSAATESTTTISIAPERIRFSAISSACSPLSGCEIIKLRSEEHTSELQSRPHLVCRLLLEKKNIQQIM